MIEVEGSFSSRSSPVPHKVVMGLSVNLLEEAALMNGPSVGFRDHDDSGSMILGDPGQQGDVAPEQGPRFKTLDGLVFMHGQQTVNHEQRGTGNLQFVG